MTKWTGLPEEGDRGRVCRWCRRGIERRAGPGRPREFCSARCRQADWVARRRSAELDLGDASVVVERAALDAARDDLYELSCAVDDVRRDLGERSPLSNRELLAALTHLLDAASHASSNRLAG